MHTSSFMAILLCVMSCNAYVSPLFGSIGSREYCAVEHLLRNRRVIQTRCDNHEVYRLQKRRITQIGLFSVDTNDDDSFAQPTMDGVVDEFAYSGSLRPGRKSPQRIILDEEVLSRPNYADDGVLKHLRGGLVPLPWNVEVKSSIEVAHMRAAGRVARNVLDAAGRAVQAGVTTDEIDSLVHEETIKAGAYPSPLNYYGFTKSCSTSVNEVICHGIPDDRKLQTGDIVNIDVTVYLNGYHGDCSEMFVVGPPTDDTKELLQATYDSWILACQYVKPGHVYHEIGGIIEDHIVQHGYSSVREFCGHGVGSVFHTSPKVFHYKNSKHLGIMRAGTTFTIEPMICEGTNELLMWPDEWTVTTIDGKRSAQFEHTLLITCDGVEALTGKTENSMVQFWEEESTIYKGFWLGTSKASEQRASDIRNNVAEFKPRAKWMSREN